MRARKFAPKVQKILQKGVKNVEKITLRVIVIKRKYIEKKENQLYYHEKKDDFFKNA